MWVNAAPRILIRQRPTLLLEQLHFVECQMGPVLGGLDARPPGLPLAMHGHIETSPTMP
ncbi:hypothetical protein CRG98_001875 [Punica granatum]|uniref:Uncharacterized protein n=1 Tax=Punica granatum TaxID=22663 RepID=A0A2I0LAQ7_PUNGR|nr:hypothetical protein CRG98_001875 [Punica granatum]